MSIFKVIKQELFIKASKKLSKKYKNINSDVDDFLNNINSKNDLGVELKQNIFKARIANSDKNKGKSAGYRLISYLKIVNSEIHLLYIYDKSQLENLTENQIDDIVLTQLED